MSLRPTNQPTPLPPPHHDIITLITDPSSSPSPPQPLPSSRHHTTISTAATTSSSPRPPSTPPLSPHYLTTTENTTKGALGLTETDHQQGALVLWLSPQRGAFVSAVLTALRNEFLEELRKNAYHGWIDEDVVNHIAKVLEMIDLIYIPGVDSRQLRIKVFPLSLADDARQWWINEGEGKSMFGKNLLRIFFVNFIPNHTMEKKKFGIKDDRILSSNDTTTDSFFRPYLKSSEKNETEKDNELSQTKRKYSNTSKSIDEQPNKRMCKAEMFEAIQYSLGPNEEYIAIRKCEYDIWERNEDNMSKIYQDIFQKKNNGWKISIRRPRERNIDEYWWRIYKSGDLEVLEC
ncbi:hypothetical protein Tco_0246122 [Tanacetum coccineum]